MSFVFDPQHTKGTTKGISADTAIAWRGLFEHHLRTTGKAEATVIPAMMSFGGVTGNDVTALLAKLLQDHGVPADQAGDRAGTIIDKLGRTSVAKALRSSQAWRELKQLANQCSPKLQLVLASELQAVIADRTKTQTKFGSKQNKSKHPTQPRPPIQLAADDISIPDGIFQDADGKAIKQISINSIGPDTSGIVVAHAQQAVPYLKLSHPVSKQSLAMLVLESHDPMMHGLGEEIRFPARFERTSEPILLSAKLVQLGAVLVSRIAPEKSLRVDEVHTQVIRVVLFRDEVDKQWEALLERPVKHLVQVVGILQPKSDGSSVIMDVWDRQWLNLKLERTKPSDANIFMASFRLECSDITSALKESGTNGCYVEPRSPDGRSPAQEFRVIWLNKMDKQSVMIASQSTEEWTCIVRSGSRFGLRVHASDAQAVHERHKPLTPFLQSDQVTTYHVGPIPHGSNRMALTKLFQSWSWQARPCQPKSRTPDGRGVVWECQAIAKPPFEVYQMEHSDVLITEVPKKAAKAMPKQPAIQASAKTMAVLTASDPRGADQDPWDIADPWSSYQTPVKSAKRANASDHQSHDNIDLLAAKVQQKLQPAWTKQVQSKMDVDHDMQDHTRIQEVEDRLATLEKTVQHHHAQQGHHVKELATQINKVQQNVDQQGKAFQAHLDDKLDQQLQQIEQLLSKRSRME